MPSSITGILASPRKSVGASVALLGLSAYLLFAHATAVRDMSELGLPAAVRLTDMRERSEVIAAQREIAELQATLYGRADEEYVRLYVLPDQEEIDRIVAVFDRFFGVLRRNGDVQGNPTLSFGQTTESGALKNATVLPVSFTADVSENGLRDTLMLLRLSGLLGVADTLTPDQIDELLLLTEQERPDVVASLEYFLSLDIRQYAQKPTVYRDRLLSSFEAQGAATIVEQILRESSLPQIETFMAEYGSVLQEEDLWPIRFLTVEHASIVQTADRSTLSMTLYAHGRSK